VCICQPRVRRSPLDLRRIFNWNSLVINKNPRNQVLATLLGRDVATKMVELVAILVDTCGKNVALGIVAEVAEVVRCGHDCLVVDA